MTCEVRALSGAVLTVWDEGLTSFELREQAAAALGVDANAVRLLDGEGVEQTYASASEPAPLTAVVLGKWQSRCCSCGAVRPGSCGCRKPCDCPPGAMHSDICEDCENLWVDDAPPGPDEFSGEACLHCDERRCRCQPSHTPPQRRVDRARSRKCAHRNDDNNDGQ